MEDPTEFPPARIQLASRLRAVRIDLYGERGQVEMADLVGIRPQQWYGYERGGAIPALTLLRFLEATGVDPRWLLRGEGPMYRNLPPAPL